MPDTHQLHNIVRSHRSFEVLVEDLNNDRSIYEFIAGVEGVGREVAYRLDNSEPAHVGSFELGWLWLLWEAYHSDEKPAKLKEGRA